MCHVTFTRDMKCARALRSPGGIARAQPITEYRGYILTWTTLAAVVRSCV